jgi:hypothetical protein
MKSFFLAISLFLTTLLPGPHTTKPFSVVPSAAAVVTGAEDYPLVSPLAAATSAPFPSPSTLTGANITQGASPGTSTTPNDYVTHDQFAVLTNNLRSLVYALAASSTRVVIPEYIAASGNPENPYAANSAIDQLNGTALNNVTVNGVTGLTAANIPSLSSLSGLLGVTQGGTGTSTAPGANRLLFSDANGNWEYVATSSLGVNLSQWTSTGSIVSYAGGSVVIGTTTANHEFDVWQSNNIPIGLTTTDPALTVTNAGAAIGNGSTVAFQGVDTSGAEVTLARIADISTSLVANAASGNLAFFTRNAGTQQQDLTILSNGKVGIGTATPLALLSVSGGDTRLTTDSPTALVVENTAGSSTLQVSTLNSSQNIFEIATSTGAAFLDVTSGGNLGIGTTTPFSNLALQNNYNSTNSTLFAIASSTTSNSSSASTIFSIDNIGDLSAPATNATTTIGGGLVVSGSQFVVQQGSGWIGIGTTTPAYPLVVQSSNSANSGNGGAENFAAFSGMPNGESKYRATNNVGNSASLDMFGSAFYGIPSLAGSGGLSTSNSPLIIATDGNSSSGGTHPIYFSPGGYNNIKMTLASSGNLGIGTTSPTAILTLDSSSTAGTVMRVSNSSAGGHIYDWLSTGSANTGGAGRLDLFDYTEGAARLSIAPNGNVGIGTTTPGSILSVSGVANLTAATSTFYSTGGINLTSGCFSVSGICITSGGGGGGSGTVTSITAGTGLSGGTITTSGTISLNANNTNTWSALQLFSGNASSTNFSNFGTAYFGGTATSSFNSSGALALVSNGLTVGTNQLLVSGGNVGIGTTSPQALLGLQGGIGVNSTQLYLASNGNVGIGESSVNARFEVNLNNGANLASFGTTQSNDGRTTIDNSGGGGRLYQYNAAGTLTNEIQTNGSNYLDGGNVGIGTTSPATTLSVVGNGYLTGGLGVGVETTTAGTLQTSGNATIGGCVNYNGGTSGTCLSDERVKQDINSFTDGLQTIVGLNPVTYEYNGLAGTPNDGDVRTGLIAQQVQQVAPDLVSTTSALLNASDTAPTQLLEVNYGALTFALINAVKEVASISGSFESTLIAWLGNASNGITDFFADNGHFSNELCVGSTCVTPAQFQAMVAIANASQASGQESSDNSGADAASFSDSSATPPVLQVNGDNPTILQVGDTYIDLGATITGPQADLDLGITTYVNGIETNPVQIDTSVVATDTIDYVATDQKGLTATSTRTVIIEAPSIIPTADPSSTADASATTTTATTTLPQ